MQSPSVFCGCFDDPFGNRLTRRSFLTTATATSLALTLCRTSAASVRRLEKPVRFGVIADLHHDLVHDGIGRMEAFVKKMATSEPDVIMQLGDFAYPNAKNSKIIELFNQAHQRSLHVIGNHDMDAGHTKQQCLDIWRIPARY